MRGNLIRLAPAVAMGVTASLLIACGDSVDANGATTEATADTPTVVATTTTSPVPAPTSEANGVETRPTVDGTPSLTATPGAQQNRSATPLVTATSPSAETLTPQSSRTATSAVTAAPLPAITSTPTATPPPNARAAVGRVVTARAVDALQRPVDETSLFAPGERVYITVEYVDVRAGAELGFAWEAEAGCNGSYTTPPQSSIRRGFFGFFIDQTECVGRYDVKIQVDGVTLTEIDFLVRTGQPIG